jgi:S-adenosylmethionine:tRNA ribosyltransferase-isomerase
MNISDFDYDLPRELIAQRPVNPRDSSRLLVVNRATGTLHHDVFRNIVRYLPEAALMVVNNSRVIPARLLGIKERSGGEVELFLLRHHQGRVYEAMLRPLRRIRDEEPLVFPGGLKARLIDRSRRLVEFDRDDVAAFLEKTGHIPLPPYIAREDDEADRKDYQTVYAKHNGSVAAPTAGLHFTRPLISELKRAGHTFAEVTLHVNYGTFKPVEAQDVVSHPMHSEDYHIRPAALKLIRQASDSSRPVIAVGTTSCRVLESYARYASVRGDTRLFLYPGERFHIVNGLITNFHLPRSTLFMLVCALGGLELIRHAYEEAVRNKYRFYSYGDAMLIL